MDKLVSAVVEIGDDARIGAILEEVCNLTGMGFAALTHVSSERWIAARAIDRINFGLSSSDELDVKTTICDDVCRQGGTIAIDDCHNDPDWWSHPTPILYGFRSYVSIPIMVGNGRIFGTMCAIDPDPHAVTNPATLARLNQLALDIAAIVRARLDQVGPLDMILQAD